MGTLWAVLIPAYGKKYHNAVEVIAAFRTGKDFILRDPTSCWDNKPCNIRDLKKYSSYEHVELRYGDGFEGVAVDHILRND